jgi:DNA invertase Pin-like site-specific DNA recombinase
MQGEHADLVILATVAGHVTVSGGKRQRPELNRMLDQLRAGDVLVVSRLDRLARSTRDLLELAELLKQAEAGLS